MTARSMMYDQGVFASRPAASVGTGYVYFATDTGNMYVSDGASTWTLIASSAGLGSLAANSTLNAIAAANATSGNVSMASNKITNLTNGSSAQDAAAFGQIPTGAYAAYAPTWSSSGDPPDITDSTVLARYTQIGKHVHAYGRIVFGGSATFGTGTYTFALPVTAHASAVTAQIAGGAFLYSSFSTEMVLPQPFLASSTTMAFRYSATYLGVNTVVGASDPFSWSSDDIFEWNIVYEAA